MSATATECIDLRGNGDGVTGRDELVYRTSGPVHLTADNAEFFGRQVSAAMRGCDSIELDLEKTSFMDCAGLGALIALGKLARCRHGVLGVVNPRPSVRQLFEIVDAGRMFEIGVTRPAHPVGQVVTGAQV